MALSELPPLPSGAQPSGALDAHRAALRREPAERAARAALPGAVALWVASETFHATHVPALDIAFATAALAALLYARMVRKAHKRSSGEQQQRGLRHARQILTGTALAGGWLAFAVWHGPLYGPHCAVTLLWLLVTAWGLRWLHRHEVVTAAKQWRARKMGFLSEAGLLGIRGAHMISREGTRLGESFDLDTTGTGRRASSLAGRDLDERIAERRGLPFGRVHSTAPRPGRLRVSIQERDPWKHSIPHPLTVGEHEIELPVPTSIRDPLIVGQDPDTGRPLRIALLDSHGAKVVAVVGKKDAGKSTLFNCIRERVTACGDALLVNINVSGAVEDLEWQPACYESAVTAKQQEKAVRILDWLCDIVATRPSLGRDTATFQPTPGHPAIVCTIDEIGVLMTISGAAERLRYLASQNRKEGVVIVFAGQRAINTWIGGTDVKTQIDIACIGRVGQQSEANHAAGDAEPPNMSAYGEGNSGVWWIGDREAGGRHEIGRAFNLSDILDVRELAYERQDRPVTLEAGLPQRPGAKVPVTAGGGSADPPPGYSSVTNPPPPQDAPPGLGAYDMEHGSLEDTLGPDERARLAALDAKRAENDRMAGSNEAMAARLRDIPDARLAEVADAAWAEEARKTMIDDGLRLRLLRLVAGEGMSGRSLADELGEKRYKIMQWMNRLRFEGLADSTGRGKTGRYKITTEGERWLDDSAA